MFDRVAGQHLVEAPSIPGTFALQHWMKRVPMGRAWQLHLGEVLTTRPWWSRCRCNPPACAPLRRRCCALGFLGGAADVRVRMTLSSPWSGVTKALGIGAGLHREHVHRRAAQLLRPQGIGQRVEVHHRAAAVVDEIGALLHGGELVAADQAGGGGGLRHVQGHHVALRQQFLHGGGDSVLPWRSLSVWS